VLTFGALLSIIGHTNQKIFDLLIISHQNTVPWEYYFPLACESGNIFSTACLAHNI